MLATTGFLLANKGRYAWMRPPEVQAEKAETSEQIISVHQATQAAFALGHPELQTMKHVDRVDYRPKSNVFKVVSKEGYREVQVDGKTGKVLSSALRYDQLTEDIHDMSIAGDVAHDYGLPAVAIGLGLLSVSGIGLFFTPVYRRWQFRRGKRGMGKPKAP